MSPRNEAFQAVPFNARNEANEPLIVAVGDAGEEEDHRLEEKAFSRSKISALLLGLLVTLFIHFSILVTTLLVITLWGEDITTKFKTNIGVFSLLLSYSFFLMIMVSAILELLRHLVTITYSVVGERSNDFLEEMVLQMECRFCVVVCLAWSMMFVLLGTPTDTVHSLVMLVVALFWRKLVVMCSAIDSKLSSFRRSTAEKTMTAV